MTFRGIADVLLFYGLDPKVGVDGLSRMLFKTTTCGAFVQEVRTRFGDGLAVGSVTDGRETQTRTHLLSYPFTSAMLEDALHDIESEADETWRETGGKN